MKITVNELEDHVSVQLIGELDTQSSNQINIDEIIINKNKKIIFDCSELSYISSSGLRKMLEIRKETLRNHQDMILKGLTPSVIQVFEITNFDSLFTMEK